VSRAYRAQKGDHCVSTSVADMLGIVVDRNRLKVDGTKERIALSRRCDVLAEAPAVIAKQFVSQTPRDRGWRTLVARTEGEFTASCPSHVATINHSTRSQPTVVKSVWKQLMNRSIFSPSETVTRI